MGHSTKLLHTGQKLEKQKARALGLVVAILDEVAWLFNLRDRHRPQSGVLWLRDSHRRQQDPVFIPEQVSQVVLAQLEVGAMHLFPTSRSLMQTSRCVVQACL